jgi:hypothetical protein
MKKIISFLVVAVAFTTNTFAQISEGKVKYSIEFSSSDPAVQAQLSMLKGSTLTMIFSPEFNRTEGNMGMFMQSTSIVDLKSKETLMLMSGMMGKKAIKVTPEDLAAVKEDDSEEDNTEIEKTNDTKKIAGFKCTKYILTTEEGDVMNYWVTDELKGSKAGVQYLNDKIEGFPLEFEFSTNGMVMTFSATEVVKNLKGENKKTLFSMEIPEGFEIASPEDLRNMGM